MCVASDIQASLAQNFLPFARTCQQCSLNTLLDRAMKMHELVCKVCNSPYCEDRIWTGTDLLHGTMLKTYVRQPLGVFLPCLESALPTESTCACSERNLGVGTVDTDKVRWLDEDTHVGSQLDRRYAKISENPVAHKILVARYFQVI